MARNARKPRRGPTRRRRRAAEPLRELSDQVLHVGWLDGQDLVVDLRTRHPAWIRSLPERDRIGFARTWAWYERNRDGLIGAAQSPGLSEVRCSRCVEVFYSISGCSICLDCHWIRRGERRRGRPRKLPPAKSLESLFVFVLRMLERALSEDEDSPAQFNALLGIVKGLGLSRSDMHLERAAQMVDEVQEKLRPAIRRAAEPKEAVASSVRFACEVLSWKFQCTRKEVWRHLRRGGLSPLQTT